MTDKIIIITNADMAQQSGDVVLLNRRSKEFYKQYNVKTSYILIDNATNLNNIDNVEYIEEYTTINNREDINNYIISNKP
ncbi:hypothetical protein B0533_13465, partial [Sedimentibacter sp. SX930]